MFNLMKTKDVDIHAKNNAGVTGLEILERRVREDNPYDNLRGVKLFYRHVTTLYPGDSKLRDRKASIMFRSSQESRPSFPNIKSSKTVKLDSGGKKGRNKKRGYSTRTRKPE